MTTFNHKSGEILEINGAEIYYEQIQNGEKPVLLFLHGGFGNIEDFNGILNSFSDDFYIIGIDSRGQGKSTLGTEKLTYEVLQNDIERILNHLQIKKLSIIGFSDGGIIAYRIAKTGNFNIDKLITIGSTWSLEDVETTSKIFDEINIENAKEIFAESFKKYKEINPYPDFEKLTKLLLEMWTDKSTSGHPYRKIETIATPTLIVRGNDDVLFSLNSSFELQKKLNNSILFNIPFASHEAFKEQPEVFETIVKAFLSE